MGTINWKQLGMLVVSGAVGGIVTLSGWLWMGGAGVTINTINQGGQVADTTNSGTSGNTATVEDVVKKVSPAVVAITAEERTQSMFGRTYVAQSGGSGFVVRKDGLIVTNKHVVNSDNATYTVTMSDGKKYPAKVQAKDPVADLALIKISAYNLPVATLGDSSKLALGQRVIAIGNTLGEYQNTVTTGVISGVNRNITATDGASGSEKLNNLIQTDAAINPGNSGGPLIDMNGTVIGINTAVDAQAQAVGFAIPINSVKNQIQAVASGGEITRPKLGVRYIQLNPEIASANNLPAEQGALVAHGNSMSAVAVEVGGPADVAGIKEGDILTTINGVAITESNDLVTILQQYKPGDKISVKLLRQGQTKTVQITLGKL